MKLPVIKPKDAVKALKKAGFEEKRQTGSHLILRHSQTKKIIVVPMHSKDIKKGTLRSILRQADLSVEEFVNLL